MTWEEYIKLKRCAEEDLDVNENNALEKSLKVPYIYHKYLDVFITETKEYKNLNKQVITKYSELYKKFKYQGDFQLDSKAEVEVFINGENAYLELKHRANIQETIVQYLENLVDRIGRMSFDIKNFIEYSKFLAGK